MAERDEGSQNLTLGLSNFTCALFGLIQLPFLSTKIIFYIRQFIQTSDIMVSNLTAVLSLSNMDNTFLHNALYSADVKCVV